MTDQLVTAAELLRKIRDEEISSQQTLDDWLSSSIRAQNTSSLPYAFRSARQGSLVLLKSLVDLGLVEETEDGRLRTTAHLEDLQATLGLSLRELARLRSGHAFLVEPRFGVPKQPKVATEIFVVMPFSDALRPIYDTHLKAVASSLSLTISRGDDVSGTNAVIDDIWSSITAARIVIAEFSKRNPNVFYELGVAHTLGCPTVLLSQDIDDVPFNLRHLRTVVYSPTAEGLATMESAVRRSIIAELGLMD